MRVVRVQPRVEQIRQPRQECRTEYVQVPVQQLWAGLMVLVLQVLAWLQEPEPQLRAGLLVQVLHAPADLVHLGVQLLERRGHLRLGRLRHQRLVRGYRVICYFR